MPGGTGGGLGRTCGKPFEYDEPGPPVVPHPPGGSAWATGTVQMESELSGTT